MARRRPYLVMTSALNSNDATPTPVRIQEFSNAFPTLAISKKYVPKANILLAFVDGLDCD